MVTTVVKTIGSSSRNYSTPQAWEDAAPADLTAVDQIWRGECYNDSEFVADNPSHVVLTSGGVLCDDTRYLDLTAADGESAFDNPAAPAADRRYDPLLGVAFRHTGTSSYKGAATNSGFGTILHMSRIQCQAVAGIGSNRTDGPIYIDNMLVETAALDGSGMANLVAQGWFKNCILINKTAFVGPVLAIQYGSEAVGNTVVCCSDVSGVGTVGIRTNYSTSKIFSNAVFGFETAFLEEGTGAHPDTTGDYNATDDDYAPGSHSLVNLVYADQFEGTTTGAINFKPKAGNSLLGAGLFDADLPTDIFGRARANPPTAGAEEYVALTNDVSMAAGTGVFTLTGKAAGLKRGKRMPAAKGTFALSGKDANLIRGRKLPAAKGTFTLTGKDAALSRIRRLVAAKGAFTLAGKNASLYKGPRMAAGAGAFTLTGKAASFKRTYAIAATKGGFNLTGIAVTFKRALKLAAAPGAFILAGKDATLSTGSAGNFVLTAGTGSFTLTGKAAVLRAARKIAAANGTFTLTGNAVVLRRTVDLLCAAGVFSVDGIDAALQVARLLSVEPGAFTVTGQDVRFIAGEQYNFPDTEVMYAAWEQRTIIVALDERTVYAQPRNEPFVTDEDRTIVAPNRRSN